ncbi:MAG: hypothetical protein DLM55_00050 [Acidimicrobiales bacterium]|nr:MAG: hypothetical protein DLM55_00050 [Acidimicrobiales bacterium]
MFALPAVLAAALVIAVQSCRNRPGNKAFADRASGLAAVFGLSWSWLIMALGLVEGAVSLGGFTFLVPALEHRGLSSVGAGAVTEHLRHRHAGLLPRPQGGRSASCLVAADRRRNDDVHRFCYRRSEPIGNHIGMAAILLGGGWAFMHSSL